MPNAGDAPYAVVVLVAGALEVPLGAIYGAAHPDLSLVDYLLRLQAHVARRGWSIRLTEVDSDLRELVALVGVAECLGLRPGSGLDTRR